MVWPLIAIGSRVEHTSPLHVRKQDIRSSTVLHKALPFRSNGAKVDYRCRSLLRGLGRCTGYRYADRPHVKRKIEVAIWTTEGVTRRFQETGSSTNEYHALGELDMPPDDEHDGYATGSRTIAMSRHQSITYSSQ